MTEDTRRPTISVTDHRHFDRTGQRREGAESPEEQPPSASSSAGSGASSQTDRTREAPRETARGDPFEAREGGSAPANLSEVAAGLASSFSLLVARLAQETEVYLGLVPYPGKDGPEPDFEAARGLIDMLSMLEEKTRGNLEADEARLLSNLLYTYRLEFVRRSSGGSEAR